MLESEPTLSQKLGAETLGTFVLVFFGVGTAMFIGGDAVGIALAFGISVLVMAYAVGHISGGHFNPAVSVGAAVAGRLPWIQAGLYAAAQLVGAIVAAAVLFAIAHGFEGFEAKGNMGQNYFGDQNPNADYALWAALIVEIVATAIFLYVILAATDKRNPSAAAAPAAIGLSLTGIHLVLIPLTGTSVNPARSIGPGLFAGSDAILQLWLFIVAPLVGAAIAGFTYALIFGSDGPAVPGSGLNFAKSGGPGATGFAGGWDPNAPQGYDPHQQWGQPAPDPGQQPWGQPVPDAGQQPWGAPEQPAYDPNAWGQPQPHQPQQDPNQWGQPQQPAQDPNAWGQPQQPQQWGQPPQAPEEGPHTQIRPPANPDQPS